jgi:hypothetical protein
VNRLARALRWAGILSERPRDFPFRPDDSRWMLVAFVLLTVALFAAGTALLHALTPL